MAFSNYYPKISLTLPLLLITRRLPKKEQPKFHCHLCIMMELGLQPVSSSYFRSAGVCLTYSCKYSMPPPPTPPSASRFLLLKNPSEGNFHLALPPEPSIKTNITCLGCYFCCIQNYKCQSIKVSLCYFQTLLC